MIKKQLVNRYKFYDIYEITCPANSYILYNAECVNNKTLTATSHQDILKKIDEYWLRQRVIRLMQRGSK